MKAKKNKTAYKNTDKWIDAVYRNNKENIDAHIETTGRTSKKVVFKRLVKEYIDEGKTPKQAVRALERSTIFTEVSSRLENNAYSGLKGDKEAYKAFREYTKERGRFSKVDKTKMKWDKDNNSYIYDNKVRISYTNSPYSIVVEKI